MALTPHVDTIRRRHDELDEEIADLVSRPSSDDLEITRLKREKLHLKDQMKSRD